MSAELAFIFSNVFDGLFVYDEKYNELKFKPDITARDITENINRRSKGLRDIWYRCYPALMKEYKLKSYGMNELLAAIEKDDDYPFIPNAFVSWSIIKDHIFMKPIEQDYLFERLTEQNDRDHFSLMHPVRYANGLNVDNYAERGLIDINRIKYFLSVMNVKWSIKYLNDYKTDTLLVAKRLYNEPNFDELFALIVDDSTKRKLAADILENAKDVRSFGIIPYSDVIKSYRSFDFTNEDISCRVTDEMVRQLEARCMEPQDMNTGNRVEQTINALKDTFHYCLRYKHSGDYLKLVLKYGTLDDILNACFTNCDATIDWMVEQRSELAVVYVSECIRRKLINRDNLDEYVKRFALETSEHRFDIGFAWIEAYKEEPPLMFYPSPNYREQRSIDRSNPSKPWQKGKTIADCWSQFANSRTIPMEMTSMKYYDYMVKSNGVKRNPDQTIMYSYFSNSNENKLIFCRSNIELLDPAIPRFYIPVDFKKLKQYLHEDLLTTDICMFAQLTKNDWEKVAGGREDIDIVAFNDMKNVYRERTPLRDVIKYLIDNVNIEFDVECQMAGVA